MTIAGRFTRPFRMIVRGVIALSLALIGMVALSAAASAHSDAVASGVSCASPLGTGYVITWTVSNEWDLSEAGTVTALTGGVATLHATTFSIAAQDDYAATHPSRAATAPYLTAELTQQLPATASGVITLTTYATWADGIHAMDSGTAELPLNCGPAPVPGVVFSPASQSIAGHIYLCDNSHPSTTEIPGGTLASTGPQTLGASPNPLPVTKVAPGTYTMTATPPPGYVLVACGGASSLNSGGTSATEGVVVPVGGSGVGIFYVTNSAPSLSLVKYASQSSFDAAGQTINYDYVVTNTGDVTLAAIEVVDAHVGLNGLSCPDSTLAPAATETCSATYQVTAADVSAGSITNTATAQGLPTGALTPISSSPSSVTVPFGSLIILKQVCGSEVAADCGAGGSGPWLSSVDLAQGDTAYWRVTVTNTGATALANVTVNDPLAPGCDTTGVTLAVGASASTYCALADITGTTLNVATGSYAGELPPFPSSSAQVEDTPAPSTSASVVAVTPIATSGSLATLVPVVQAPAVTG